MTIILAPAGAAEAGRALKEGALRQLDNAAEALDLDPGLDQFLRVPERTLIVSGLVIHDREI